MKNQDKFVEIKAKTYKCLNRCGSEGKKEKGMERCVIKRQLKFENFDLQITNLKLFRSNST